MPELRLNNIDFPSMVADFAWSVDYAADVHEGEAGLGGFRGTARPFTEVAVAEFPLEKRFAELMKGSTLEAAFTQLAQELGDKFQDVIDHHDWGIQSNRIKQFRNSPTWKTITDSGALANSQSLEVRRE
jgi:hypothetical protein